MAHKLEYLDKTCVVMCSTLKFLTNDLGFCDDFDSSNWFLRNISEHRKSIVSQNHRTLGFKITREGSDIDENAIDCRFRR